MKFPLAKISLYLFFALLLATPFIIKRYSARNSACTSTEAARQRFGFYFQEVARASGVNFTHTAPTLDPKLNHIMPQVASMGAGVAVADFDKDGWADFYLTNSGEGSQNALYHNQHDGTFDEAAASLGVADLNHVETGVSMGAVWGDYDNDGFEDLLIYKWGLPELFHNDAGKKFTRVTENAGLPDWVNANNAIWFDFDRD
ncbi:MAG: VCBS repeat-containing protein, partial [Pyrinomonadaceae bacterium]